MNRMKVTCGDCGGVGHRTVWRVVSEDNETGRMESKTETCKACGGICYTEYVLFSVEEAEAILKHCGLPVEEV